MQQTQGTISLLYVDKYKKTPRGSLKNNVEKPIGKNIEPDDTMVEVTNSHNVSCVVLHTHGARGVRIVPIVNTTAEVMCRVSVLTRQFTKD